MKRRNDRTESIAFRKAKELVFRKTKTVKEASIESVKQIRKEQIVNYWNSIIQNNPKVIRVVGKFAAKELKQDIRSIFTFAEKSGETYQKEIISQAEISKSFAEVKDKVFLVDRKVNQSMVLMVGTLPQHNHPDFYALQLLNYILGGGGFNSYMMQQIRVERGLAYSATSFPLFKANYGVFYAYSMTKNKSLIEVYNLMQKILSKSTFAKITEKELQKAKGAINNKFVFLFSDKMKIVSNQLRFDEDKMPKDYLKNYRKKMQKVTLEDLRRVGEKYFVQKKLKTILVAPKSVLKGKFPEKYKVISPDYQFPQN
ncbi:MAG: insulinase family protein [Spirochaetota bacterium]